MASASSRRRAEAKRDSLSEGRELKFENCRASFFFKRSDMDLAHNSVSFLRLLFHQRARCCCILLQHIGQVSALVRI